MTTVDATSLLEELPASAGPERERALLDAIVRGRHLPIVWSELHVRAGDDTATLFVSADAIQVGSPIDAVRVNLGARTAQLVADHFGALLPTARICDLIWQQASVRLTPCLQRPDSHMSDTSRMLEHSRAVDAKRQGRPGLVENVGKHWVLTNRLAQRPDRAANYGWFDASAPNGRPWQPVALAHDVDYVDYSQVVRLVRRDLIVNGQVRDLEDIGRDAALCALVSSEGPLGVWRVGPPPARPVTPWQPPYVELPPDSPDGTDDPDSTPDGESPRDLQLGATGADVAAWQKQLLADGHDLGPWGADGKFGTATHNATVAWQRAHAVPATGVVDAATRAAVHTPPRPPTQPRLDAIPFVAAKRFTPAERQQVDWIVLHTMEARETATTAENCARYFASDTVPSVSAHYCVDSDSIVQCVRDEDVAWHAPGANKLGIGIEHAGYARQSAEEWADPYTRAMLELSARLVAELCQRWNIPVAFIDADGLKRGERGITTHRAATWAFEKSTHLDPGPHFPIERYLDDVRRFRASPLDAGSARRRMLNG